MLTFPPLQQSTFPAKGEKNSSVFTAGANGFFKVTLCSTFFYKNPLLTDLWGHTTGLKIRLELLELGSKLKQMHAYEFVMRRCTFFKNHMCFLSPHCPQMLYEAEENYENIMLEFIVRKSLPQNLELWCQQYFQCCHIKNVLSSHWTLIVSHVRRLYLICDMFLISVFSQQIMMKSWS